MPSYYFGGAPVTQYSPAVFDEFVNQIKVSSSVGLLQSENGIWNRSQVWGARVAALDRNAKVGVGLEPYDQGIFTHGSDSAYPPDRSHAIFPSILVVSWSNASLDETMANAVRGIANKIQAAALADGQNVSHAAVYPNYALFGTPLEDMYGGNVERLREIKAAIDPEDVMGLAGGWKF
jgi:Berberine and berberine like